MTGQEFEEVRRAHWRRLGVCEIDAEVIAAIEWAEVREVA